MSPFRWPTPSQNVVSTLHHQFRSLTAMSPLQNQKTLRLQTARQRRLMDGLDATTAAYEVGYESLSQFSRGVQSMLWTAAHPGHQSFTRE